MIINCDTATEKTEPFGTLTIDFYTEAYTDQETEMASEQFDEIVDEIEELIRLYVALPNSFRLVTER